MSMDHLVKTLAPVEPVAEVRQLPIPVTLTTLDTLFGDKRDGEGMPRVRFAGCTRNHGYVWSKWLPCLRELVRDGWSVTFYAVEARFAVGLPCPFGCGV